MYSAPRLTAQLAERLRSELPGYAVSLGSHPARGRNLTATAARIVIADPHVEAVSWVDVAGDGNTPSCVVEVRVLVHVAAYGDAPAAMVGDSVSFDAEDSVPVDEVLTLIARLLDDDLVEQCASADRATREGADAGRLVYLNDWPV
jgi:hypothetical protein